MSNNQGSSAVAANVLAEIARQRRSRRQVAEAAGMSYTALTRRLNGHSPFTVDELQAIAGALEVSISTLLGEVAA